jgi:hypothetical protein
MHGEHASRQFLRLADRSRDLVPLDGAEHLTT